MRPSATRSLCRPAPYRDGPPMSCFRRIRCGSATTPAACGGWCGTASMRRSRACSFTRLGRCLQTRRALNARAVRPRRFSTGDWRRLPATEGSIRCQRDVADCVRWRGEPGSRSSVCGRTRGGGAGWCAASRRSGRVPPRPAQGSVASGERLSRAAVSGRRRRQGSGRGAGRDSPRVEPSGVIRDPFRSNSFEEAGRDDAIRSPTRECRRRTTNCWVVEWPCPRL